MCIINQAMIHTNSTSNSFKKNKYIIVHYTGNISDTAHNNTLHFNKSKKQFPTHYFVDDSSIWQVLDDNDISWDIHNNFKKSISNNVINSQNGISIAMCSNRGIIESSTINNTVYLIKLLMNKYNIPSENIVRHFDICDVCCPGWVGWGTLPEDSGILWNNLLFKISPDYVYTSTKQDNISDFKKWLNNYLSLSIPINNSFNIVEKKFAIMAFQKAGKLIVTGIWSENCLRLAEKSLSHLHLNTTGDFVKICQGMLLVNQLYFGNITGKYDQNTMNSIIQFQKIWHLNIHGICGTQVWTRLLE